MIIEHCQSGLAVNMESKVLSAVLHGKNDLRVVNIVQTACHSALLVLPKCREIGYLCLGTLLLLLLLLLLMMMMFFPVVCLFVFI